MTYATIIRKGKKEFCVNLVSRILQITKNFGKLFNRNLASKFVEDQKTESNHRNSGNFQ